MQIRKAMLQDCASIAQVQVDSYRTAYAGILPQAYLDHFTYEEQMQDWRDLLSAPGQDVLLVAAADAAADAGEVTGYALSRPGPTGLASYDSELVALHVRRPYQKQGIGRRLVAASARQLQSQGCASLMLWVLERNSARSFYERLGGQRIGEQTVQLGEGDVAAKEIAYGWPDIQSLCALTGFTE